MTKVCPRCQKPFPATSQYFNRDRTHKDGLCSYCRTCDRAKRRAWRRRNYQHHRAYNRLWAKQHPAAHKAILKRAKKRWIAAHPELYRETRRRMKVRRRLTKLLARPTPDPARIGHYLGTLKLLDRKIRFLRKQASQNSRTAQVT